MMSFDKFKNFYSQYNRLPNNIYCNPNKKLNPQQLKNKYDKYIKSIDKQKKSQQRQIERTIERQKEKLKQSNITSKSVVRKPINPSKNAKKKQEEHKIKNDELREKLIKRSGGRCEIYPLLTSEEKAYVDKQLFPELTQCDIMHVEGRSCKNLKYDLKNVVYGMRYFHSCIDTYHNFFGKSISSEERNQLWIRIIGIERWNYIKNNK